MPETPSPAGPGLLVEAERLTRCYGRHYAVREVSFTLRRGQILGFLGPNGAGKSTTMQMLAGVLAPGGGRIRINGIDLMDEPRAARRHIGYLPETPPLYPELTVDEYLDYCARLRGLARGTRREARERAKQATGLADSGRRLLGALSKGYQQRAGIAQAIIHRPAVVILDEPTVGLDPIQIREIRSLIAELGREHSVILSTHILPEVQAVCSAVQIIHRGQLVYAEELDALNARRAATALRVGARRLPDDTVLAGIAGVRSVTRLDAGHARLEHAAGDGDVAAAVAAAAVQGEWGLQELVPEEKSLEQIFVELTATDETRGEAA